MQRSEADEEIEIDNYKKFEFEEFEWDNIPAVVPGFVMHLEKRIERQYQFNKELLARETTKHLRQGLEKRIGENESIADKDRAQDQYDKEQI